MSTTTQTAEPHEADAFSVLGEALESAAETFGDLTASAGGGARSAAHSVSKAVGTGVYKGSYGLSFGVVFTGVFLTELLPVGSALRRGFADGATSAITSASERRFARERQRDGGDGEPDVPLRRPRARRLPANEASASESPAPAAAAED